LTDTYNTVAPVVAPIAKTVGKQLLASGAEAALPLLLGVGVHRRSHRIPVEGGTLVKGIPLPHYTNETRGRIATHGLMSHQRGTLNGLHGGSFLPLGS